MKTKQIDGRFWLDMRPGRDPDVSRCRPVHREATRNILDCFGLPSQPPPGPDTVSSPDTRFGEMTLLLVSADVVSI
jgi:hypothetical protein